MMMIFDLDGTVTSEETLPIIAKRFNVEDDIAKLTQETIKGNVPFVESFIKRVHILGRYSVSEISKLLGTVKLYPSVCQFIAENKSKCVVATGNLDCWIDRLMEKVGCTYYSSKCIVNNDHVEKLTSVLKKETIVKMYQDCGEEVVFIGDSNNDVEAMRLADISIATGLTHAPAVAVNSIADYGVYSEEALCHLLKLLL